MSIQDLIDQFEIQGAFRVYVWDYDENDDITLAKGHDFECEHWKMSEYIMGRRIKYMYAVDGVLNIEIELEG